MRRAPIASTANKHFIPSNKITFDVYKGFADAALGVRDRMLSGVPPNVKAADARTVAAATEVAGLPADRIVEAEWFPGATEAQQ